MYKVDDWGGIKVDHMGNDMGTVQRSGPLSLATDKHSEVHACFAETTLTAPLLFKKDANGELMKLRIYVFEGTTIHTDIYQKGKQTRTFKAPIKVPPSKTPEQKAFEQLVSKWNKKANKDGWSPKEGGEEPRYFEPMLLHRWDKFKDRIRNRPIILMPKLDGVRGTYYPQYQELVSRKREVYPIPHLVEQLRILGVSGDGEIYKHGYPLEEITGAARRQTMKEDNYTLDKRELEFHLFDRCDMRAPFVERYASLYDLDLSETPNIKIVPCITVNSTEEADEKLKALLDLGYEGFVARDGQGLYEKNTRVYHTLKGKPLRDDEFLIVDIAEDKDSVYGSLISFICKVDESRTFKVTPAWSKEQRASAMKGTNSGGYIGKYLTVEYREKTKYGVPKHAVGKTIREDL